MDEGCDFLGRSPTGKGAPSERGARVAGRCGARCAETRGALICGMSAVWDLRGIYCKRLISGFADAVSASEGGEKKFVPSASQRCFGVESWHSDALQTGS